MLQMTLKSTKLHRSFETAQTRFANASSIANDARRYFTVMYSTARFFVVETCLSTRSLSFLIITTRVILLPRDAMRKRDLCCRPVSVCPSVSHVGALYPDG